ncbi:class I SAM-dependent methyltransferase [Granulosicoccus antarcticus]|uniref:class I SAM-dependent methyltransferase n=1 Tax=Granulosicoccus antarcticus TaxID=437505 RepID=UPI00146FC687|nr:class I SAM-dependent methyltransferase [Granulosicoccus antarcticus]
MISTRKQGVAQATEYWDKKSSNAASFIESVEQNSRPQRMRYESFVLAHELSNSSLLDVGCGAGDFLHHLRQRDLNVSYTGTDISANMINTCQSRFPEQEFLHLDIADIEANRKFDYVVSFGIHNIKIDSGWEILKEYTAKQFELCRKGAHISILTNRYSGFDKHIQCWAAEQVLEAALAITPYVVLRHDYLPNDFSVTLYREPLIDTRGDLLLDYG